MERLLDFFVPKTYKLHLNLNKHQKTRQGTVEVFGKSKSETIKFHCVGTEVDFVRINGENAVFELEDGVLTLKNAPSDDLTIEIGFHGALNENMQGAYLSTYKHENREEKIISTQFESHYARECFPCIDEPSAKAIFELDIAVPDEDDAVISNTPVLKREKSTDKNVVKITTFFEPTPVMSTYLLAFVVGKFHSKTIKNKHGIEITTFVPMNQREETIDFANEIASKSLDFYDELFGTPYPLKKLDQVAIPDFEAGAMENWGLVTYRESCLLADEKTPIDTKKSVAITISHELSHQWFGNLVTMKWWDDLWLNESFASVMEYFAVNKIHPEYNIWEDFFTGDCLSALRRDALEGVQSVRQDVNDPAEIATLFDGAIVYAKGAHLMLMLIRLMGEKQFFEGIKEYFKVHAYKNTSGDDLWEALQKFTNFNVKEFMHAWISQPGYPVITDGVAQRFLLSGETDETKWPLPEITDDMSGHYLLNLSGPEFSEKIENFDNLSLEQRLRLLVDRMLLAKTSIVSSASLIELLGKFKDEKSASVWDILISIISDLKLFFDPETEEEKKFKQFIVELITPNLTRLGVTPKEDEPDNDNRLRLSLLSLARYAEDSPVLEELKSLYDEDFFKINSEIRYAVLSAKFYFEEDETFDFYLENYQTVSDPELKFSLLCALTSARKEKSVKRLIELLKEPKIVKPQDHLYLYIYLRRNHKSKTEALKWLFENWEYVEKMSGEKSIEDYPRYTAGTIKTEEESEKFFAFFEKMKEVPVLRRTLKIAETEISSRIKLIKMDQKSVWNALK
ncbi:M1 family metallopeptidase [Candidatus Saccharibacteria bacterium]|nr:M1 family metallopeptidase [Candidatus Saccharibacteria bacterium]